MAGVPDKVFWSDPDIKLGGNTNDNLVPLAGMRFFYCHIFPRIAAFTMKEEIVIDSPERRLPAQLSTAFFYRRNSSWQT